MNLIEAAGQGSETDLAAAIANTNDLDAKDDQGWTALMVAMVSKSATVSMVKMLLENGADPNALTTPPNRNPFPIPQDEEAKAIYEELMAEMPELPEVPKVSPKSVLALSLIHI